MIHVISIYIHVIYIGIDLYLYLCAWEPACAVYIYIITLQQLSLAFFSTLKNAGQNVEELFPGSILKICISIDGLSHGGPLIIHEHLFWMSWPMEWNLGIPEDSGGKKVGSIFSSPNWQGLYKWYNFCGIYPANWLIIYHRSHLFFREPGFTPLM